MKKITEKTGSKSKLFLMSMLFVLATLLVSFLNGCGGGNSDADLASIAEKRGLTTEDMESALKTYVPPGKYDEFYLFASGGHSGQVHVIGIPSMRLLKTIAVFSPESWQGYGVGNSASEKILADGSKGYSEVLKWGDTHHPALSETNGEYDGRFLYINDRAHGRIAFVDLKDWRTKEIFNVPNIQTSHGGVFVTPNTEYAHISSKIPKSNAFDSSPSSMTTKKHLENYKDTYRGASTFLKIDQSTGHFIQKESFQLELPPYNQDLADAGKGESDGYAFINSFNAEMATGGVKEGQPSIEVGASKNDFDYLHIINWKKAEEVVAKGKYEMKNGMRVIPINTLIEEGILYLAPEPRSPHGVDISPNGRYIVISGKLDPHTTAYGIDLIKKAIEAKDFEGHDYYGIPILNFKTIVAGQVEAGSGPLHTQFDDKGYAYTSLFLDNAVAKWSLGEPYFTGEEAWKLVDKITTNYNIGHLSTAQGDTRKPEGKYLVAMNKWSIDRYSKLGPLMPQNFQLIDISGDKMKLLADMPIGFGEPHYAQMARADKFDKTIQVYPLGTDPETMQPSKDAIKSAADARIVRNGNNVDVYIAVVRSTFTPDIIQLKKGDHVKLHLTNVEQTPDATHGFAIAEHNIMLSIDAGETVNAEFTADKVGSFSFYCTEFCSALHLEMQGWILVE